MGWAGASKSLHCVDLLVLDGVRADMVSGVEQAHPSPCIVLTCMALGTSRRTMWFSINSWVAHETLCGSVLLCVGWRIGGPAIIQHVCLLLQLAGKGGENASRECSQSQAF